MKDLFKGKTCVMCEEEKKEGMHVYTAFICWDCEREIVKTDPEEERYADIVAKLRKIGKPSVFS